MTSQAILEKAGARSDDVRAESLELALQGRLGGRVKDLRVDVRAGGLVLQGRTSTYHAKQLAQHAAMELAGLPILANDIEVI
jgi:hypothetical protein